MKIIKPLSAMLGAGVLFFAQGALAQVEGEYVSDGADECELVVTQLDLEEPRFGDAFYRFRSRGVAACMWDGIGIATSTTVAGAYVSLPPTNNRVYITMRLLYGPNSPQVEVVQLNQEGEEINRQVYSRQ
ncbi:MAG: hypothetical protein WEB57_10975 [Pseudohongiellaceae bacterium]